jgi:uridine kinase
VTDEREIETVHIEAKPVILVEGIPRFLRCRRCAIYSTSKFSLMLILTFG